MQARRDGISRVAARGGPVAELGAAAGIAHALDLIAEASGIGAVDEPIAVVVGVIEAVGLWDARARRRHALEVGRTIAAGRARRFAARVPTREPIRTSAGCASAAAPAARALAIAARAAAHAGVRIAALPTETGAAPGAERVVRETRWVRTCGIARARLTRANASREIAANTRVCAGFVAADTIAAVTRAAELAARAGRS